MIKKNGRILFGKKSYCRRFHDSRSLKTFDCYDLARTSNNFQTRVYGIKYHFKIFYKKNFNNDGNSRRYLLKCFKR